jgi:TP901 family phage tail tape measure protein
VAFKLLELFAELTVRDGKFTAAMGRVQVRAQRMAATLDSMAQNARRVFLVSAGAVSASMLAFTTFEKSMAKVLALSGATANEFKHLTAVARTMGLTTVFTAKQAAEAMAMFALQGFKAREIIEALPATLNLAAAADLSMAHAATITAGVMRGMKLEAKDLGRVVDNLARAAANSATTLPDLGEALRALGPVAAATGVQIEEVMAAIRGLANVMIRGAVAGTAMRNILIRLQAQPSDVAKELRRLNIVVDDGTGKMKGFADIVEEINTKMEHYTAIQRNAAASQIAGLRATAAFNALLDLGADRLREWTKEQEEAAGSASRMTEIRLDTVFGDWKLLYSAITDLAITMGQRLAPAIRAIFIAGQQTAISIKDMSKTTHDWTIGIIASTAAISGLILVSNGLIVVLAKIRIAMIAALHTPVILAAAALAAVILAYTQFRDKISGVTFPLEMPSTIKDTTRELKSVRREIEETQEKLDELRDAVQNEPGTLVPWLDARDVVSLTDKLDALLKRMVALEKHREKQAEAPGKTKAALEKEDAERRKQIGASLDELERKARHDRLSESEKRLKIIRDEMRERLAEVESALWREAVTYRRAARAIVQIMLARAKKESEIWKERREEQRLRDREQQAANDAAEERTKQVAKLNEKIARVHSQSTSSALVHSLRQLKKWFEEIRAAAKKLDTVPVGLAKAYAAAGKKIFKDFIKPLRKRIESIRDSFMGISRMSLSGLSAAIQAGADGKAHREIALLEEQIRQARQSFTIFQRNDKRMLRIMNAVEKDKPVVGP